MIWASWVIFGVYFVSIVFSIAIIGKPRTSRDVVTPGSAAFIFVMSAGLIGCLNLIGWNWATLIVAADVVWTIGLGLFRIGKMPRPRTMTRTIIGGLENAAMCALIVVGSLMVHRG